MGVSAGHRVEELPHRVAILGLGLIGGSIGLALRERRPSVEVAGWDPDESTLLRAGERGAISDSRPSAADAVADANLIVLAAPLSATIPLLESILASLGPDAVITDVGSVKARIVREAEALAGSRFVGGHPMAGSERCGIDAACPDLFAGAPWLLTPTVTTSSSALSMVEALVRASGAVPRPCDPTLHDEIVAAISHLPHVLAYGLAQTAADLASSDGLALAAGSYCDGTRVAASPPALWADILLENRDAVLGALAADVAWLQRIVEALQAADAQSVRALLESAHRARYRHSQEGARRD